MKLNKKQKQDRKIQQDKDHWEFIQKIRNRMIKDPTVEYVEESDYQLNQRRSNTST